VLAIWKGDYNTVRPHSSVGKPTQLLVVYHDALAPEQDVEPAIAEPP
jgi:hypothetical protein